MYLIGDIAHGVQFCIEVYDFEQFSSIEVELSSSNHIRHLDRDLVILKGENPMQLSQTCLHHTHQNRDQK